MNLEAKEIDELALCVCIRLGFIQARLWELFGNAPIHPALEDDVDSPMSDEAALDALTEEMKASGHICERAMRGNLHGLLCDRCGVFHHHGEFGKWKKPCRPKPVLRQLVQAHARKKDETRKRAIHALVVKQKAEDEESAQKETSKRMQFGVAEPTAEDDAETARYKEGLGPWRMTPPAFHF